MYKATLETVEYIGVTDNSFKTRYNNHKESFQSDDKKSATTLAAYIHNKGLNPDPTIRWEIVQTCPEYAPGQPTCSLCLSEKLHIVKNMNNTRSLNKRTDIGNKCTFHRKKHYLNHITWNNRAELGGGCRCNRLALGLEIAAESSLVREEERINNTNNNTVQGREKSHSTWWLGDEETQGRGLKTWVFYSSNILYLATDKTKSLKVSINESHTLYKYIYIVEIIKSNTCDLSIHGLNSY